MEFWFIIPDVAISFFQIWNFLLVYIFNLLKTQALCFWHVNSYSFSG